jgi:hypothetical protein
MNEAERTCVPPGTGLTSSGNCPTGMLALNPEYLGAREQADEFIRLALAHCREDQPRRGAAVSAFRMHLDVDARERMLPSSRNC